MSLTQETYRRYTRNYDGDPLMPLCVARSGL